MNKKKEQGVPRFILVAIAIVVLAILFGLIVFNKFLTERKNYVKNHEEATAQINLWEDTLSKKEQYQNEINALKEEYDQRRAELFIDAAQSIDDVNDMLLNADLALESINISESAKYGGSSSSGDPIYATTIAITLYADRETLSKVLHYFEQDSIGSYYITDMTVQTMLEKDDKTGEEKPSDYYSITMKVTLYYFVPGTTESTASTTSAA